MVTLAIGQWITECFEKSTYINISDWLHSIKGNRLAYELAYACLHYFIPYWATRSSLKYNKFADSEVWWRYWIHLFIATNKTNYSRMSIRFLWVMWSLNPIVKQAYDQHRVLSFSREEGSGIPYDGVCELVSIQITTSIRQACHQSNGGMRRASRSAYHLHIIQYCV